MFAVLKHLFKLQFLIILIAILCGVYYPKILDYAKSLIFDQLDVQGVQSQNHIYTKEALAGFNGEAEDKPIYLSILGSVYDVTKGKKHYGPGCSYGYFAGRDASKSFITGDFENFDDSSDDVLSLKPSEVLSLYEWKKFYDKEYTYIGLAVGRFYDKNGVKTKYHYELDAMADQAIEEKKAATEMLDVYPPCNIAWTEEDGTRVWCTDQSGGKKRDWIGVPRKYYEAGKDSYRCACVKDTELDSPKLKPYENCDRLSPTCFYKVD